MLLRAGGGGQHPVPAPRSRLRPYGGRRPSTRTLFPAELETGSESLSTQGSGENPKYWTRSARAGATDNNGPTPRPSVGSTRLTPCSGRWGAGKHAAGRGLTRNACLTPLPPPQQRIWAAWRSRDTGSRPQKPQGTATGSADSSGPTATCVRPAAVTRATGSPPCLSCHCHGRAPVRCGAGLSWRQRSAPRHDTRAGLRSPAAPCVSPTDAGPRLGPSNAGGRAKAAGAAWGPELGAGLLPDPQRDLSVV